MSEALIGSHPQSVVRGVGVAIVLIDAIRQRLPRQKWTGCGKRDEGLAARSKTAEYRRLVDVAIGLQMSALGSEIANHDPRVAPDLMLHIQVPVLHLDILDVRVDHYCR